jgi:hypothetical protein
MLVLSVRKEGHVDLYIGEGAERVHLGSVKVLHASHGTARLGFEIDKTVTAIRGNAVQKELEAAA